MKKIFTLFMIFGSIVNFMAQRHKVYLNNNLLTSLPDCISDLKNLNYLVLANNKIRSLPNFVVQLTSLKDLWLEGNQLDLKEISKIKSLLPKCEIYFQ